jgi:hypothetical protein
MLKPRVNRREQGVLPVATHRGFWSILEAMKKPANNERREHEMGPLRRFWRYLVDRPLV